MTKPPAWKMLGGRERLRVSIDVHPCHESMVSMAVLYRGDGRYQILGRVIKGRPASRSQIPGILICFIPHYGQRGIGVSNARSGRQATTILHSKARILSQPMYLIAAWISSRAMPIVLFPKLTVTTNRVDSGNTPRDSYHAGPLARVSYHSVSR